MNAGGKSCYLENYNYAGENEMRMLKQGKWQLSYLMETKNCKPVVSIFSGIYCFDFF